MYGGEVDGAGGAGVGGIAVGTLHGLPLSGGILIENVLHGPEVSASIVGIGLNLNQTEFPPDLPNPVSLSLLTGRRYDPEKELLRFMRILSECADKTNTAEGRRYLDRMFRKYMFRLPS